MKNLYLHICTVVLCLAVSACSAGSDTLVNPGTASKPLTVLAGAANKASVYRSTDDGETWTESIVNASQTSIGYIASNGSDLYCANVYGIYHSTDGGLTWRATADLGAEPSGFFASASTLIAPTRDTIKWSTDKGDSWQSADIRAADVENFAFKGQMLYCASFDFIYASPDNGKHWSLISNNLHAYHITALASDDSFLYAGSVYNMLRTSNNGMTWDSLPHPGVIAPINSMAASNGSIYAANDQDGIYRSSDRGFSWQRLSNDLLGGTRDIAVKGTTIFACGNLTPSGITKSTDGGKTWKQVLTTDCLPILIK